MWLKDYVHISNSTFKMAYYKALFLHMQGEFIIIEPSYIDTYLPYALQCDGAA